MLSKIRLSYKLGLLAGVPVLGLAIFAWTAMSTLGTVSVQGPLYAQIIRGKDLTADILPPPAYIVETHMEAQALVRTADPAEVRRLRERFDTLREEYDTRLKVWQDTLSKGPMRDALLEESRPPAEEYFNVLDRDLFPAALAGNQDEARRVLEERLTPLFAQHRAAINKVVGLAAEYASRAENHAVTILDARTRVLWAVAGAMGLGALALGWLISRNISRPVLAMERSVRGMACGELPLSTRLDESRRDELGVLAQGVNSFTQRLAQVIGGARDATFQVMQSSAMLEEHVAAVAQQMESQAARVREVASAMTEMSASAAEVAQQAGDASNAAHASRDAAGAGGQAVAQTVDGMHAIENAVTQGTQRVHALGERSDSIGRMIQVINDIADQTNLLALNAAIEAARAGEHGRGFAVVADEVRKLADRTQQATAEISRSIKQIQDGTREAVSAMDQGGGLVRAGVERAARAGGDLERIVADAESMTRMVGCIATAAAQQSSTTEEVSRSLEEIANATTQTQESARESAAGIQQVAAKASDLQALIDGCGLKV